MSKHFDIDSLEERCYTCDKQFENYNVLMKHRKESHPQTINECHYYKSGDCKFQERCFYRHSEVNNRNDKGNNQNYSFHKDMREFPPDIADLTEKLKDLMTFLSNKDKQTVRSQGH